MLDRAFLILAISLIVNMEQTTCHSNWKKSLEMQDLNSRTDYLITIYSATDNKPCFYFAEHRFSQPESGLINCTWYKANSCCKRTEVASVFADMFTLNEASNQCMNLMNYMMCYFCSPDQYIWYRDSQVAICRSFCDTIFNECKYAEYKGHIIGEVYRSGVEFCEAQDFLVVDSNQQCFQFDSNVFSGSKRLSSDSYLLSFFCILFEVFLFLCILV